ncbi:MAG: response regulator [Deltaproteobacteria bacterium]|nr:response regulator [Deltaproteobacteria bacterium]
MSNGTDELHKQVAELTNAAEEIAYLRAMEQFGVALRGADGLESTLESALDALLDLLSCDRAWLLTPCDPQAQSWGVPMERTVPAWPGVFAFGVDVPMDPGAAGVFADALATEHPVPFDASTERSVPADIGSAFGVRSQMVVAIRTARGPAWLLGLHHCGEPHVYSPLDQRILGGAAHRMEQALDALLLERDLRKTESRLEVLSRTEAIGTLAAGLAHDFVNKLLVIIGYAELLRDEQGDHEFIDHVVDAADQATDLTRELLAFSRRAVLRPRAVDLSETARTSVALLRKALGSSVQLELAGQGSAVGMVDPAQLEQVLVNLVLNARDALPEGGTIGIETGSVEVLPEDDDLDLDPGHYATLSVADNGTGMDDATLKSVFEPFFTTKERGKGTGLGLSTAYGVAKQSGGTLTATSAQGEGSVFTVFIPATDDSPSPSSGSHRPVTLGAGSERVLFVDEDPDVGRVTAYVLGARGYSVLWAGGAREALDVLEQGQAFDLLVTQVMTADIDGVTLAARATELLPDLKVTFTTAYSGAAIERLMRSGSARRLLQKPYSPDALVNHVRMVLDS